jgi:very-short-patch-repair endonuclease
MREAVPSIAKTFRFCSIECSVAYMAIFHPTVSRVEKKLGEAMHNAGLHPIAQCIIGPFIADFAFIEQRLVIECDGDYWHNLPNIQKKDKRKNYYLWSNGWDVLHIWEHEINESLTDCIRRIQDKLQSLTS